MINAADYYSSYDIIGEADCSICRESLHGTVMAHGKKHPVHELCIKEWLKIHGSCPECREVVDIGSLFSWRERVALQIVNVPRVAAGAAGTCAIFGSLFMLVPDPRMHSWSKTLGLLFGGPEIIRRCLQQLPNAGQRESLSIYHLGLSIGSFSTLAGVAMLGYNLASITGDIAEEITGQRVLRPFGLAALPAAVSLTTYIAKKLL